MPRRASPRLALIAVPAVALCALGSCGDSPPDPFDAAFCEKALNDPESADAYDWLKAPAPVPRRPGSMTVDEALSVAHHFEARGAERIVAVGNRKIEPRSGASYLSSLGLVLRLPEDPVKRLQVFRLYAEQIRNNGYTPRADTGQNVLFIPWTQDGTRP